jgi:hypothetical protein
LALDWRDGAGGFELRAIGAGDQITDLGVRRFEHDRDDRQHELDS